MPVGLLPATWHKQSWNPSIRKLEKAVAVSVVCSGFPGKVPWKIAGNFLNPQMLQIIGFRAPRKANLPAFSSFSDSSNSRRVTKGLSQCISQGPFPGPPTFALESIGYPAPFGEMFNTVMCGSWLQSFIHLVALKVGTEWPPAVESSTAVGEKVPHSLCHIHVSRLFSWAFGHHPPVEPHEIATRTLPQNSPSHPQTLPGVGRGGGDLRKPGVSGF